jgi:hypothetical protein
VRYLGANTQDGTPPGLNPGPPNPRDNLQILFVGADAAASNGSDRYNFPAFRPTYSATALFRPSEFTTASVDSPAFQNTAGSAPPYQTTADGLTTAILFYLILNDWTVWAVEAYSYLTAVGRGGGTVFTTASRRRLKPDPAFHPVSAPRAFFSKTH